MSWVQVLSPTSARFDELHPLLAEALELVKGKWNRHHVRRAADR